MAARKPIALLFAATILFAAVPNLAVATHRICPSGADGDSDDDGLIDSSPWPWVATEETYATNECDPDSDGDLMPDGYEVDHNLLPNYAGDGGLDADDDGLSNAAEYCYGLADCHTRTEETYTRHLGVYLDGTHPGKADTDNDKACDGGGTWTCLTTSISANSSVGEVDVGSNATDPDTDDDRLPDGWELAYGFDPAFSQDTHGDPDGDSYDRVPGGAVDQRWTNVHEYCYSPTASEAQNRAASCNTTAAYLMANGPNLLGTNPLLASTDGDCATDGSEVYYDVSPTLATEQIDQDSDGLGFCDEISKNTDPADPDSDDDGLCDGGGGGAACLGGWGEVINHRTNPLVPDTDGDGLCDGGLGAAACTSFGGAGEVFDYDTDPLVADSDGDGLTDAQELSGELAVGKTARHATLGDVPYTDDSCKTLHPASLSCSGQPGSTDARFADTDGDYLYDGDELLGFDLCGETECRKAYSNPNQADTDGDSTLTTWLGDKEERAVILPGAFDRTTAFDPSDYDADRDDLSDGGEIEYKTDPNDPDTDHDLLADGAEVHDGAETDPKDADSVDGDRWGDFLDPELNHETEAPLIVEMGPMRDDYYDGICAVVMDRSDVNVKAVYTGSTPVPFTQSWVPWSVSITGYDTLCIDFVPDIVPWYGTSLVVDIADAFDTTTRIEGTLHNSQTFSGLKLFMLATCWIPGVSTAGTLVELAVAVAETDIVGMVQGQVELGAEAIDGMRINGRLVGSVAKVLASPAVGCFIAAAEFAFSFEGHQRLVVMEVRTVDPQADEFVLRTPYAPLQRAYIPTVGFSDYVPITYGPEIHQHWRGSGYSYLQAKFADRPMTTEQWRDSLQAVFDRAGYGSWAVWHDYDVVTVDILDERWQIYLYDQVVVDVRIAEVP